MFGGRQNYAYPSRQTPQAAPTAQYMAPIHGAWASSGGFTFQPINATHPKGHMGVDMRAPAGTAIYPLAPGVVSNVGTDPMGGNVVNVAHAGNVKTYYAHMSAVRVQKGDKVNLNTILGTVGNTGNASHTFPHLHFQVWKDGQIQDPANFFSVPPYTPITQQELAHHWVSDQAKQEAEAFNMKDHVAARRAAFASDVARLGKIADEYYQKALLDK